MNRRLVLVVLLAIGIAWLAWRNIRSAKSAEKLVQLVASTTFDDDFQNSQLTRVTDVPFRMSRPSSTLCRGSIASYPDNPHGYHYCHVFVSEPGANVLLSGKGTYPVGTVIIKQKFTDASGSNTTLFTVMEKMRKGYDTEFGDWEYSVFDSNGKDIQSRGRIKSCISCHAAFSDTDYVTRAYMNSSLPWPSDEH